MSCMPAQPYPMEGVDGVEPTGALLIVSDSIRSGAGAVTRRREGTP